jgi:putative hydrolase of the HAD superfamily
MVEDNLDNLRTAKRLGMRTVWMDATPRSPTWIDVNIRHLRSLPRSLARLS